MRGLGWLLILLASIACHVAPQARVDAERAAAQSFDMVVRRATPPPTESPATATRPAGFDAAFERAVELDPEVGRARQELERRRIDAEQAGSGPLPRVNLFGAFYAPLGRETPELRNVLTGGVAINWDLVRALQTADIVAAEVAKWERSREQLLIARRNLYWTLRNTLARLVVAEEELRTMDEAARLAHDSLALARIGFAAGRTTADFVDAWERDAASATADLRLTQTLVHDLRARMASAIGADPEVMVEVEPPSPLDPMEIRRLLSSEEIEPLEEAWARSNEVHVATLDVLLAELEVVAAKRRRLPRFQAGVAAGNVPLTTTRETTYPLLPYVETSFPLIDWGDVRRAVARAQVGLDAARQSLVELARSLLRRLDERRRALRSAEASRDDAQTSHAAQLRRTKATEILVRAGRADALVLPAAHFATIRARLTVLRAELQYDLARQDVLRTFSEPAHLPGEAREPTLPEDFASSSIVFDDAVSDRDP